MIWILLAMLVILLCAGVIVLYVAFPHRGEEMPHTPWIGRLMRRGVRKLPTIQQQAAQERAVQEDRRQDRCARGPRAGTLEPGWLSEDDRARTVEPG